jgi:hypothetical protein
MMVAAPPRVPTFVSPTRVMSSASTEPSQWLRLRIAICILPVKKNSTKWNFRPIYKVLLTSDINRYGMEVIVREASSLHTRVEY